MKKLTLTSYTQGTVTVVENEFIDQYMAEANGEYVKVYLLLLRHMSDASALLSISHMADLLDCTEKDVIRALKYWKKQGLLDYCEPPEGEQQSSGDSQKKKSAINSESIASVPGTNPGSPVGNTFANKTELPDSPAQTSNIQQYRSRQERKEFKELLFVAEQYLGKTLSSTDIDTITYFFDTLHMSGELIEYLIEYCVENNHKSMHYIKKVALSWKDQNITNVSEAKSSTALYNKNCYSVLNAYGIKGRAPAASEVTYIRKWNEEYGFALDIILEACNRTMKAIHQPNFEYTDGILKKWLEKNVHSLKDVTALDADYLKEKERGKKQAVKPAASMKNNKFNNFSGRSYNMEDLERKLVQQ